MNGSVVARCLAFVVCLTLLSGLFVLGGLGWPTEVSTNPDPAELAEDWDGYLGEEIEVGGDVVDAGEAEIQVEPAEPLTPLGTPGDPIEIELEAKTDLELEDGDEVTVAGIVEPENTLATDPTRVATRQSWETRYMYAVSAVGLLFAILLGANFWRLDVGSRSLEPRDHPLVSFPGGDHRA